MSTKTIDSILVPVDFSTGSAEALRYALALRRGPRSPAREARVEVIHVFDASVRGAARDEALRAAARRRELEIASLASFIRETVPDGEPRVTSAVVEGEPRAKIPERASGFDLVVIGASGLLSPAELVPGGVAEATVRRSSAPVLTVKWLTSLSALASGRAIAMREIIFATDLTPFSAQALPYAMALAHAYGARITALHVVANARALAAFDHMPFPLSKEIDSFYERELGLRKDDLGRFVHDQAGADPPVKIAQMVRAGRPPEQLALACHDLGADLLVIATHGAGGLRRALLGSTAESALRLAPCPILTVRPKEPAKEAAGPAPEAH